jgi:hypothetical protein
MSLPLLTKSNFTHFLKCPILLWLDKVRPDLKSPVDPATQRVFDQGNEVDALAQGLYPQGIAVEGYNQTGFKNTQQAIASGAKILFQPTAIADGLTARADILIKDKYDAWDIYEVKMATEVKDEYYDDVAFQKLCFTKAGIPIGKTYLVHINNTYVRKGQIDVKKLFTTDDITDDVNDQIPEVIKLIPEAQDVLAWSKEIDSKQLLKCPDLAKCGCVQHWFSTLSASALENILTGLPPEEIGKMIEKDVIDSKKLSKKFIAQIPWRTPGERWPKHIDQVAIREEFQQLRYPLYYFDYETIFPVIPPFDGCHPYQQVPFQFSVHEVDSIGATPKQFDFLKDTYEDPRLGIIEALRESIGPVGSVISWNASFEMNVNKDLAEAFPEHAEFLLDINNRMYDLMQPFKKKKYVDPSFRGSASLKAVLPTLFPDLSYDNLNIHDGGQASASWEVVTDPKLPEEARHQLRRDMIEYCRLDVYGMVKILEHLHQIAR